VNRFGYRPPADVLQFGSRSFFEYIDATANNDWDGKPYEDKDSVIQVIENRFLKTTYWSSGGIAFKSLP
jgi:hypothetical protein